MTSIERTAYPRFKRLITARELHLFFSPSREEVLWSRERADSEDRQLSLLLLKSYQRMARFPKRDEVPEMVVDFVRKAVELPEGDRGGAVRLGPHDGVDGLGATGAWLEGLAVAKIADFAGEAEAADVGVMQDYAEAKRITLMACLVHKARMRVRDDLTTMFCKRVAIKVKRARSELEEVRLQQQSKDLDARLLSGPGGGRNRPALHREWSSRDHPRSFAAGIGQIRDA
ncbi:DUF4158 domain-containing protein [Kitasatospora sp. NBC_01302]|uniref:DUF4158 domain-containing protein n=1 Tax=Kitasatospora sp. NBC_01302 TaxID=2903575 RepID=UPI002E0E96A4|nr:DUF4158 domain-containing protein [Kitasatospora sp. NBC_01302]